MLTHIFDTMKNINLKLKDYYAIIIPVMFAVAQFIIFIYYKSYLKYFNVDISFYNINIIESFSELFINFFIVLAMSFTFYVYYEIFNIILKSYDYSLSSFWKKLKENGLKADIKGLGILLFLFCCNVFFTMFFLAETLWSAVVMQILFVAIALVIMVKKIYKVYKINKNNELKRPDANSLSLFNIIFIVFTIIAISTSYGISSAMNNKEYIMINEGAQKYIVLYNTNEYAIVANYMHNKDKNEVCILNNKITKIDLNNKELSYWTFKKINLESKGEC